MASNNNGRLIKMEDGLGEETYTYDSLGRTTQVAKKIYNVTYTTSYTYNLAGGVVNATYPSGRVVKHEYDNIGRLKNVKNNGTGASYLSNAAYSTANQLTGFTYGNSVVASYGYSANRLQLTSLSYAKSGTTHLSLSYSYSQSGNNNGQIAAITDNQQSGRTVSYTYDSLHRLKTAVTNGSAGYPQWGLSWSYDRYGNRTGQSVTHGSGPSSSPTISTSTNRITALGGSNYYYDANGSLTQDDLFKYKYDAENRVVEIRNLSDTLLTSYAYDGHSMQVIKVASGTRTWFLYAGSQLVSEYYDAASNTYSSPTSPGSAPADSGSTLLYQHSDHLTTRVTTDNAGTLSNQQAHYPYGENWYATGTADPSVKRKFTSYRKETDSSLASGQINYAVARYHGARIGRFHRPDPVRGNFRNPQRLNRYAYVTNNPIRYVDPTGLDMSDGIGPEWNGCDRACIIPFGSGLVENPLASGGPTYGMDIYDALRIAGGDDSYGRLGAVTSFDPMTGQWNTDLTSWSFTYEFQVETTYRGVTYTTSRVGSLETAQAIAGLWSYLIVEDISRRHQAFFAAVGAAGFPTNRQGQPIPIAYDWEFAGFAVWRNGHWNFPLTPVQALRWGLALAPRPGEPIKSIRTGGFRGGHYNANNGYIHQDVFNPFLGNPIIGFPLHLASDIIGGGILNTSLDKWP